MKKYLLFLPIVTILLLIAGCSSKSIADWQYASSSQLNSYKHNYLKGDDKIAEFHFQKALEEVKRSGDLKLISQVYLTKYALKVALLEDVVESEYLDIEAIQPDPENRNYFIFLKGNLPVVDIRLLPKQYKSFLKAVISGKQQKVNEEIKDIDEHISSLIAVGIAVKNNLYNETTLQTAIERSSVNGWHKSLLVYLEKLEQFYEGTNEKEKALTIRQKIKIIKN